MKHIVLLVGAVIGLAQAGSASPLCVSGTLASYIALGSGGCMIGGDTFDTFKTLTGITGAIAISPASITITPSGSTTNPTITFQSSATATAGMLVEALISYQLLGSNITGDMISLSGSSASGDGAVTDIQDFCRGGVFGASGVTGCTGTAGQMLVFNSGTDQRTFAATSMLSVTHDFTLDGGLSGRATGGTITDSFIAGPGNVPTPEPASMLLVGLGIGALSIYKVKLRKKGVTPNEEI